MDYYYLDASNQPVGPATLDEIRAKAVAGAIPANPMIAPVGSDAWQPLAGGAASAARANFDTIAADAVATVLGLARAGLSADFLARSLAAARAYGHYAVTAGGALGLAYALYAAIKAASFWLFLSGLVLVLVLACAQFAAKRFLGAGETLLANTPSRVATPAFLECVGLLVLLGVVTMLLGAITVCVQNTVWRPLVPASIVAIFWIYFATVALHPEVVNIETTRGSAGEEAVGLLSFFLKAGLKIVPLSFCVLAVMGIVIIALSFFELGGDALGLLGGGLILLPRNLYGFSPGFGGVALVGSACLMPLAAYGSFLLLHTVLDLVRSILAVPAKLDALKR